MGQKNLIHLCAASLLLVGLAGCGGGGSSDPSTPSSLQFPLAAALSAFGQASHNYTINASNAGNTYTVQIGMTPGAASTFGGEAASTMNQVITESENNVVIGTESQDVYFVDSPYKPLGVINLTNGQYTVAANQIALPTTATVGQSGQFITETIYTSSAETTVYATATATWSLVSDTATTAWACTNTVLSIVGGSTESGSTCYEIDTTGNVLAPQMTLTVNGTSLTFQ